MSFIRSIENSRPTVEVFDEKSDQEQQLLQHL